MEDCNYKVNWKRRIDFSFSIEHRLKTRQALAPRKIVHEFGFLIRTTAPLEIKEDNDCLRRNKYLSAMNRNEQWEASPTDNNDGASFPLEDPLSSQQEQQQQQGNGKRRKRFLSGKVRNAKPTRITFRRVFKKKSRQDRDLSKPTEQDTGNGEQTTSSSSILRRSLGRMMSTGSMSRTTSTRKINLDILGEQEDEEKEDSVRVVEGLTRNMALLCGAYVLGASKPEYSPVALRLLEFVLTAWMTCLLILGLGSWRKSSQQSLYSHYESEFTEYQKQWQQMRDGDPEMMPLVHDQDEPSAYGTSNVHNFENDLPTGTSDTKIPIHINSAIHMKTTPSSQSQSCSSYDEGDGVNKSMESVPLSLEHPKLADFYVVDSCTGERIPCNSSTPYRISNEWLDMDMLVMIRTPDADDPDAVKGSAYNNHVSEHFRGRARRFEFQYRVKLKKVPVGKQLFFSCELNEPIKMGIVTKAFVSAAMAFVRSTNPSFHYNVTGSKNRTSDGKWESPHMSFTVEGSLDRFVVTKPGETPPKLGSDINEDPESIKRRKRGEPTDWNTEDTYTMSIWSSYVDFLEWRVQKVPGIKPFSLSSVLGSQPINMTMYLIDENLDTDTHYRKDVSEVIKLELSNGEKVGVGREAQKWINAHQQSTGNLIRRVVSEDSVDESNKNHQLLNSTETIDEMEEMDKDTADAAELGEGIYLRSGDSVLLQELEDEKSTACTVINGGGFAVLSKRNVPVIIEKTKHSTNKLIKSGDTVLFKMLQTKAGSDEVETRYLTIHRRWWLKWVTSMPTKNGYFTIYTHENELGEKTIPTNETQSSFLTLGGSFSLRHKRWSKYAVGVSAKPSTDFGGRMLSLYNIAKHKGGAEEASTYQSDDEGDTVDDKMPSIGEVGWIKPLVIRAQDPQGLIPTSPKSPAKPSRFQGTEPQTPRGHNLVFSSEHSRADVPAWIELMDREQRIRQLAYVVRIRNNNTEESFARLQCGKDLARIMNIGQSTKISQKSSKKQLPFSNSENSIIKSSSYPSLSTDAIPSAQNLYNTSFSNISLDQDEIMPKPSMSSECLDMYDLSENPSIEMDVNGAALTPTKLDRDDASMEGDDAYMSDSTASLSDTERESGRKKSLRKLKKLGKKTAIGTTKLAAKGLRETGKATGKLIAPVTRKAGKQPKKEPKKKGGAKESQTRSAAKKMRKLGKIEAKSGEPPMFVAGSLSATEQSRRTASRILERMSSVSMQSSAWQKCNNALLSELGFVTDQDTWFLDGDALHLGVKPSKKHGKLLDESVVARCLWESHWREEWCGMYENSLSFYAPLAKSACHEIFYSDITSVRSLAMDALSPLPGFPILVIETAWQCHYVAFRDETSREIFAEKVDDAIKNYKEKHMTDRMESKELQMARFWQGFQTLSETSLASGAAKWAKVSWNQKSKERAVLNGRRMAFDCSAPFGGRKSNAFEFVEKLLTTALSFSFATLEQDPDSFINFLNMTSELRFLPLGDFDLSSPSTFCMFVNIYHCLLQQALLLSVNGPLSKKSITQFMRTSCYEIGGDVFSLAELHSCVICGKMSKLINPRPPYIEAPRKSNAYKFYALDFIDSRVHFVLNTADMACPASIPVLSQRNLEQQLNVACVDFFCNKQLTIDPRRRVVTVPKICEVRRNDFGIGEILSIFRFCLCEMDEVNGQLASLIREVLEKGEKGLTIKFQHTQEQYHSSLRLTTAAVNRNLEVEYCDSILESKSTEVSLAEA